MRFLQAHYDQAAQSRSLSWAIIKTAYPSAFAFGAGFCVADYQRQGLRTDLILALVLILLWVLSTFEGIQLIRAVVRRLIGQAAHETALDRSIT